MKNKYFTKTLNVYPLQGTDARLKCVESRTPGFCRLRITNIGKPLQDFFICCDENSLYGVYTRPNLPISTEWFYSNTSISLETYITSGMKDNKIFLCWQENDEDKYAIIQPIL